MEAKRLDRGLSQKAVAAALGISQPHYSKVVGGLVALTDSLGHAMHAWLTADPTAELLPRSRDDPIRDLARSISRDLRKLGELLAAEGRVPARRGVKRTRDRRAATSKED